MRVYRYAALFLFSIALIWGAQAHAASSIISQSLGVPQPYSLLGVGSIDITDPVTFVAPGTLSTYTAAFADSRALVGNERFSFQLYNSYFKTLVDCKTPERTADEWGITHTAQDPYAPMVTIGPFTGSQCRIESNTSGFFPRVLRVWKAGYINPASGGFYPFLGQMGIPYKWNWIATGPNVPDKPKVPSVLFLPGLEASRLYAENPDGSEKKFWEPGGDEDALTLAMNPDGSPVRSDLYTRDVIDNAYLPAKGDVYKSFLGQLAEMKSSKLIADYGVAPYDWRLTLDEILNAGSQKPDGRIYYAGPLGATSTPYIIQELRRLARNSGTGKVTVVAHSNGGLVAKALTAKLGAEASSLIDKMIFVAVPQAGTPQAVGAILHGYDQALPIKSLSFFGMTEETARALARDMPSVYNLLPSRNYFTYTDEPIITVSGDPLLAPWRSAYGEAIHSGEGLRNFLTDASRPALPTANPLTSPAVANGALLADAEAAHGALDAWAPPARIALTEIAGWGEETLSTIHYYQGLASTCTARRADSTCSALVTTPTLQYRPETVLDGDGTVVVPSALWTPGAKRYWVNLKEYGASGIRGSTINRKHGDIFEVPQLRTFIQNVVISTSTPPLPQYLSTLTPANDEPGKQLHFTLHSPLSLHLYDDGGNHTGVSTTTSSVEEGVPGSRYLTFGEVQYISAPTASNLRLVMNGEAEGSFTLDLAEVEGDTVLATTTFAGVPSSAGTVAAISFTAEGGIGNASPLTVDENGDGTTDLSLVSRPGEIVVPDLTPPQTSASTTGTLGANGWYRSAVSITLTAADEGSGVKETLYSLDGGASWSVYASPLTLSSEGTTIVQYYSLDNAGNTETIQSLAVKLDMTAPEAVLEFSPTTGDIVLSGRDNLSSVAVTAPYTLTDEAGNTTTLKAKRSKENKREAKMELSSVTYSTAAATATFALPKNALKYEWATDKNGAIRELEQKLEVRKEVSVSAKYEAKKNMTKIYVKDKSPEEKLKETKPGLVILRLVTNQGNLDFEY